MNMNYKIPLSKLDKFFNPFNDIHSPFYKKEEEIDVLLKTGNIFNKGLMKDNLKTLAYEIANYEPQKITISLHEENITEIENIITVGLFNLYSAFYLKKQEVIVEIKGEEKVIHSLLGNDINNYIVKEGLTASKKIEMVNFSINKKLLEDTWGSINFVFKKLQDSLKLNNKDRENIYKFIIPEMWENKDFIKLIFSNYEILNKTYSYMFNDVVFEIIKEDLNQFRPLWNVVLYHRRDSIKKITKEKYEENQNIYNELSIISSDKLSEEEYYKLSTSRSNIFCYKVKSELIEDLDNAYELLKILDKWQDGLYEIFPQSIKYNEGILDFIYNNKISIYPNLYMEQEQYNDYNFIKNFLIKYSEKIPFNRILSTSETNGQTGEFDDLLSSWINDKQKVLELLDNIPTSHFARIYSLLNEPLRQDEDIIKTVLNINIDFYLEVPKSIRQKYKEDFILNGSDEKRRNKSFPMEEILNIKDKELLINLLKAGNVNWLKNDNCLLKWKQDVELLNYIPTGHEFTHINKEDPLYETILKNKSLLIKIITVSHSFYSQLPKELKEDKDLLEIMADKYNYIPDKLFSSRKMCLEIIKKNQKLIEKVPMDYWYEKEFILGLALLVDQKNVSDSVFKYGPKEVVQLLNAFEINKNYEEFLSNYFLHQKLEVEVKEKHNIKKNKI